MLGAMLPGVQHMQNIHPLVVHFPLALLTVAAVLYWLAWLVRREGLASTAWACLLLGTLSAGASVATGLYAAPGVMISRSVRAQLLTAHRHWMFATLALSVGACAWVLIERPFPTRGRPLFLLLLLAMAVVMTKGADYGARMVYDYNAGGSACSQPIEFTQ